MVDTRLFKLREEPVAHAATDYIKRSGAINPKQLSPNCPCHTTSDYIYMKAPRRESAKFGGKKSTSSGNAA